jgi:hypothetical protein
MSNYVSQTGNIDQVGGDFIFPFSETHIPRIQGNFYTVPSGLQVKGNRKFIWSIDSFIPGLIGITNERTPTPTIEFDANLFSQPLIRIKCTLIGQNKSKDYLLFTVSTSQIQTALYPFNIVTNNNYYNIKNPSIITSDQNYIGGSNTPSTLFYLQWVKSNYSALTGAQIEYLVEIWNEGFQPFTTNN